MNLDHQELIRSFFEKNWAIWGDAQMSIAPPEPAPTDPPVPPAPTDPAPVQVGPNGFPLNVKPADMTIEHRAAFLQHELRKAQDHNKTNMARLKELEKAEETVRALEEASQTEAEKAVRRAMADGEKAGREAALAEARKTYGSQLVAVRLETAAPGKGMTVDEINEIAGSATRFLNDSGVDDEALTRFLAALPNKGTTAVPAPAQPGDLGGGNRTPAATTDGAALYAARHPKSTT